MEISSGGKAKVVTYVERDSLIELMCKQGKGRNQSETLQLYRVLALFDKHYNKWYIIEENKKSVSCASPSVKDSETTANKRANVEQVKAVNSAS